MGVAPGSLRSLSAKPNAEGDRDERERHQNKSGNAAETTG